LCYIYLSIQRSIGGFMTIEEVQTALRLARSSFEHFSGDEDGDYIRCSLTPLGGVLVQSDVIGETGGHGWGGGTVVVIDSLVEKTRDGQPRYPKDGWRQRGLCAFHSFGSDVFDELT
jgi:hypothetical protein